ncbi:xanthine dehydrogenase family protein subunit M [Notoacmeibacter sp. MSK16QG-6]|uniref:FAD binding domain-containing protein n=1 Tax=Notoacmeibacter sp. MSK16QG-6 TaxID=2957982 RepID=UPI00209CEB38|nr:xanthine dehydrogenase family protein subunit M [Notoacmeibacter sp. MSK16QG-6]MCP1200496.1 xanthine dehydrogenase family protein subunit M [Notoacmeibacter sp. MSK16QG-6]
MIPGNFEYYRPESVSDAVKLLAQHGDEARAIAGGHSLIPMMKLRMAEVGHLVDLQAIGDLKGISVDGGMITVGAMTTQHELIASEALAKAAPIIREASLQIADPQVRYVGTIGGNVANGDPGNDMPGLMQCLDATFVLAGPNGTREVAARDFYEAAYFTAREDDELLVSIRFATPKGGYAYEKQKRKIGDYATAAAAVLIEKNAGKVSAASIAMTNLSDTPVYCQEAAEALLGTATGNPDIEAAVTAMKAAIDPQEDNRGPVEFKQHVAGVILRRAIERAVSRA